MEVSIGSMFSGIGGLELGIERGLRRAGLSPSVRWQVEQDSYCRSVLRKHWPEATRYDDVTALPLESIGRVDLLCGGFPCQDLSTAGNGAGIEGDRSGLWRSMYWVACALGPSIVIMENVPTILIRGIGVVFGQMASIGYDLWWDCIPAQAIGAPHRRDRFFAVFYMPDSESKGVRRLATGSEGEYLSNSLRRDRDRGAISGDMENPYGGRRRVPKRLPLHADQDRRPLLSSPLETFSREYKEDRERAPDKPCLGRVPDGIPCRMDGHRFPAGRGVAPHSWEPPRTRAKQPHDRARLRALGNAVVPQVAEVIGAVAGEILRRGPPR